VEVERHAGDGGSTGVGGGVDGGGGDEEGLGVAGGPACGGGGGWEGEGGAEGVDGCEDGVERFFVEGEFADEGEDGGDVWVGRRCVSMGLRC